MQTQAKLLSARGFSVLQTVFCRSIILLNFAMYLTWVNAKNPFRSERKLLLLVRGIFGFLTVTSVYWSVHVMPLQDATVLMFLSPCLVALASPFILGQPVNKAVFFSIPVAFTGVVLVAQPPAIFGGQEGGMSLKNFMIGSSQAITASVAKLSVSFLGKSEPTAHIIMSMALVSCMGSSFGSLLNWKFPHDPLEFLFLLGVGVCACLVQFTATLALKRSNTASVMSISYLGIVWSILIDYIVFGMAPNLLSICPTKMAFDFPRDQDLCDMRLPPQLACNGPTPARKKLHYFSG
ncbi:hypothetical protein M9435_005700 [Picochlorum sp. BPE23]|nr:hypothetical protein M9435_005700 [Picochlorum sp. BPE23]